MAVNLDKPDRWKADVSLSIDMYNDWFINFAPSAYREMRYITTGDVENALEWTKNLTNVQTDLLRRHPEILPMLRMTSAPPIARDRLIGLARVSKNLVESMENDKRLPPRMSYTMVELELKKIGEMIERLADKDLFVWLEQKREPTEKELYRAATVVADRLCGAATDPLIRNAQEQRQLKAIGDWLNERGYKNVSGRTNLKPTEMSRGTYAFRRNVPVMQGDGKAINIPVDTVIMPLNANPGDFPLLVEAKSAGDATNTNKRRKEEVTKYSQLKETYGEGVHFVLFLCGYFNPGYLGYEAADGIDWVWEYRITDFIEFGV
jgi:hypothetical protein